MSVSNLPEETLEQIFSSGLDQQHYAVLSLVSKQLNKIVKPLLYRSITIHTLQQAKQFQQGARKEDVDLVKSISIIGKGNPWKLGKMQAVHDLFEGMDHHSKSKKEAGVVEMFLKGKLINPDQLESISVHHVLEDPTVLWSKGFSFKPQIFANLQNLSIVSHRGGFNLFRYLFSRQRLPNLERLALCDVTDSDPGGPFPIAMTSDGRSVYDTFPPSDWDSLRRSLQLEEDGLFEGSKLELLVSPSWMFLKDYPSLLHLAFISHDSPVVSSDKYGVVYTSTRSESSDEINAVFVRLSQVAQDYSKYSLEYLAVPSLLHSRLDQTHQATLDLLTNLGVAVYFDGDLGRSIAPPSFLEFRRKEEEKASKARKAE